jgi:hypothetical protein
MQTQLVSDDDGLLCELQHKFPPVFVLILTARADKEGSL